jgi:hypothetical protein
MHTPIVQLREKTHSINVPAILDGRQHNSHYLAPSQLMAMAAIKSIMAYLNDLFWGGSTGEKNY